MLDTHIKESNQQYSDEVQVGARLTPPHLWHEPLWCLVFRKCWPSCHKTRQEGQQGLHHMEVGLDGLSCFRRRQLHMLHRDTAEVLVAMRIVHGLAAEHGENLHPSRVVAVHDVNATSDEQ